MPTAEELSDTGHEPALVLDDTGNPVSFVDLEEAITYLRSEVGLTEDDRFPPPVHLLAPLMSNIPRYCSAEVWRRFYDSEPSETLRGREIAILKKIHQLTCAFDRELLGSLKATHWQERLFAFNVFMPKTTPTMRSECLYGLLECAILDRLVWCVFRDGTNSIDDRVHDKPFFVSEQPKLGPNLQRIREWILQWENAISMYVKLRVREEFNALSVRDRPKSRVFKKMMESMESRADNEHPLNLDELLVEAVNELPLHTWAPGGPAMDDGAAAARDPQAAVHSLVRGLAAKQIDDVTMKIEKNFSRAALAILALAEVSSWMTRNSTPRSVPSPRRDQDQASPMQDTVKRKVLPTPYGTS